MDSIILWINLYTVDLAIFVFPYSYPLDRNFPVESPIYCLNNWDLSFLTKISHV